MKTVKKALKIILTIIIFIASFILIDGFCARFLGTRPLLAKKETVERGITKAGVVYKSLFADVYYCDSVVENVDDYGSWTTTDTVIRYYEKKNNDFVCPYWINEQSDIFSKYDDMAREKENLEYMLLEAQGFYKSKIFRPYYNSKINVIAWSFNGDYKVTDEVYRDYYLFDTTDFSKPPIKLEIPGFDTKWRVGEVSYSIDGETMFFNYSCGYNDGLPSEGGLTDSRSPEDQHYTKEECESVMNEVGIYAFKVNGVNDYTYLNFLSHERLDEIKRENMLIEGDIFSFYKRDKILDKERILIRFVIMTQSSPHIESKELYYVWNITDNSLKEYHE